jgi:hypothetical protein
MLAEFLREAAVLVLVFALLDKLATPEGASVGWVGATIAVRSGLLVAGIALERARPEEV